MKRNGLQDRQIKKKMGFTENIIIIILKMQEADRRNVMVNDVEILEQSEAQKEMSIFEKSK